MPPLPMPLVHTHLTKSRSVTIPIGLWLSLSNTTKELNLLSLIFIDACWAELRMLTFSSFSVISSPTYTVIITGNWIWYLGRKFIKIVGAKQQKEEQIAWNHSLLNLIVKYGLYIRNWDIGSFFFVSQLGCVILVIVNHLSIQIIISIYISDNC